MLNARLSLTAILTILLFTIAAACDSAPETTDEAEPADPPEIEEEEDDGAEEEEEADEEEAADEDDPLAAPVDVAEPPEDAEVTDSGLAYRVLEEGDGDEHPTETSTVSVHYTGWTTDGERFDSSVERGEPTSFPLNAVIDGWTEGVQLMVEGEKTRFWIPADIAYGEDPGGGRPGGMLVFDIELIEIQ